MNKLLFCVTIAYLLLGCQESKKTTITPFNELTDLIDQYATQSVDFGNINALAVAVYKDGETYHNYYGELDPTQGNTPTSSTVFEIASITKIVTGSLAARAVVEKKITLDDDIRIYLGKGYEHLAYNKSPITIKHLLTHTLGLKEKMPPKFAKVHERIFQGYYGNTPIAYSIDDLLEELKNVEVNKTPGTVYAYNSVGPELVAYILSQVYEMPYSEILTNFLQELDMNSTYLIDNSVHAIENVSNSYDEAGKLAPKARNSLLGGAYGLASTLPDLMKLMKFQLESNDPLVKEATQKLFEDDDDNILGYLWQDLGIGEEEGFYYSKSGTSGGVQSILLLCPDSNYGQIIIINNTSDAAFNDWGWLFNTIENDLIKFPKINLTSKLTPLFINNISEAKKKYQELKMEDRYFNTSRSLYSLGYEFLYTRENTAKAIEIFKFSIAQNPENTTLNYGLAEAYYVAQDYKNAAIYYKKHLALNPDSQKAKKYLEKSKSFLTEE